MWKTINCQNSPPGNSVSDTLYFEIARQSLDMRISMKIDIRKNLLPYVLISTVYLQICHSWIVPNAEVSVCRTPECNELADYYKKILNPSENPCKDFYNYVCRGWSSQYPRPKHKELWADHEVLRYNALMNVKKLLEEKKASDSHDEETAKSVYKSCMNLPFMGRFPPADVKRIMQNVGNWPMFIRNDVLQAQQISWQNSEKLYMIFTGESSLLKYYLSGNGFTIKPSLDPPESPYGMLNRKIDWYHGSEKNNYKDFLNKIISYTAPLDPSKFKTVIEKDLNDVLIFRDKLRHISNQNKAKTLQRMTISQFQEYYDRFHASQIPAMIDWLTMIRSMYKDYNVSHVGTLQNTSLINVQPEYFRNLAELLASTSSRVLGNHVHLYFAERHIILDEDMESALQKCGSNDVPRTATIRHDQERFITCILNTHMEETVGKMYVNAHFSKKDRAAVTDMVLEGISVLKQQITESEWVDPALKKQWLYKLDRMDIQIGYPEWYYNKSQSLLPLFTDIDPIGIDIYYVSKINKLGISAAYLQYPIYHSNLPPVIQYGGLLSTIAHELYHMFQYEELERNTVPLNNAALQKKMNEKFRKQTQCFKDQYAKYRAMELKKYGLKEKSVYPTTVDEDIPDMMGLRLAYIGYKKRLSMGKCITLPGFEAFGCDKLFFITFASTFCSDFSNVTQQELLVTDNHNLPRIRVNGAVANMKEFAEAFKCTPTGDFVPKETCDLWR